MLITAHLLYHNINPIQIGGGGGRGWNFPDRPLAEYTGGGRWSEKNKEK